MEISGNEIIVNEGKLGSNENSKIELKENEHLERNNSQLKSRGIHDDKLATGFPSSMGMNNYYKTVMEITIESKERINHLSNYINELKKEIEVLNSSYKTDIEIIEKSTDHPVKSWNQKAKVFLVEQQEQNFGFHRELAFLNKELAAIGKDIDKCTDKVSSIEKRIAN